MNSKTKKTKLRILYGASHRVLRYEEVPLFIQAGFEVIPIKIHWDSFKTQEPGADDPSHPLYPSWRDSCTLDNEVIEKIQAIDLFKYQQLNSHSGRITKTEANLLNQWVDIIYIPNLLPAVPRILTWFKGLTLFRIYGEGKIMTYDDWAHNSGADLDKLRQYDQRYAAMLMLYSLNGQEHKNILGSHVFHVGPCVNQARLIRQWKSEKSTPICNMALSYIYENPHWTDIYHEFCTLFEDAPIRFLGKNNKKIPSLQNDARVTGIISDEVTYFDLLTDCRCLLDPGSSPFHTHYTPLEAIHMGIPVLFLENSGMAYEILRVIPKSELENSGLCRDFAEMKIIAQQCLANFEYAKQISDRQRIIANQLFSPHSVYTQIQVFAKAAPDLLRQAGALPIIHLEAKKILLGYNLPFIHLLLRIKHAIANRIRRLSKYALKLARGLQNQL